MIRNRWSVIFTLSAHVLNATAFSWSCKPVLIVFLILHPVHSLILFNIHPDLPLRSSGQHIWFFLFSFFFHSNYEKGGYGLASGRFCKGINLLNKSESESQDHSVEFMTEGGSSFLKFHISTLITAPHLPFSSHQIFRLLWYLSNLPLFPISPWSEWVIAVECLKPLLTMKLPLI